MKKNVEFTYWFREPKHTGFDQSEALCICSIDGELQLGSVVVTGDSDQVHLKELAANEALRWALERKRIDLVEYHGLCLLHCPKVF